MLRIENDVVSRKSQLRRRILALAFAASLVSLAACTSNQGGGTSGGSAGGTLGGTSQEPGATPSAVPTSGAERSGTSGSDTGNS